MAKKKKETKVVDSDFREVPASTLSTKYRTEEKWLPVVLRQEEVLDRARALSERLKEADEVKAEKSRVVSEFGDKLNKLQGEASRLSESVRTGKEMQSVKVEIRMLYMDKKVVTVRLDTNEVVESRPMFDHELQMELAATEAGKEIF